MAASGTKRKSTRNASAAPMRNSLRIMVGKKDPSWSGGAPRGRPALERVDEEQQRQGRGQHGDRDGRGAAVVILLQLRDDEQRDDLGAHRHIAGDEHDGAVFTQPASERQSETREERGRYLRKNDADECLPAARAESGGGSFKIGVEILEDGLNRAHNKRKPDERERHHDPERRKRDLYAMRLEQPPDPAVARIDGGERDARHGGRQREREIDQGVDKAFSEKPVTHEHT